MSQAEPSTAAVPQWFEPLQRVLETVEHGDLSRFEPPPPGVTRSAILLLFGQQAAGVDVLLTQRSLALRSHPGQVSFPGGRIDPSDAGSVQAALREAREETGLDPTGVSVAGTLPDLLLPPSRYSVTPVLAWWRRPSPVRVLDPAEVAAVARVSIAELSDPANRFMVRHPLGFIGPGFSVSGLFVWGFTAGILDRLLELTGWAVPWDERKEVLVSMSGLPQVATEL